MSVLRMAGLQFRRRSSAKRRVEHAARPRPTAATAMHRYQPAVLLIRAVRLLDGVARVLDSEMGDATAQESLRRVPPEAFHGAGWPLKVSHFSRPQEADHGVTGSRREERPPKKS